MTGEVEVIFRDEIYYRIYGNLFWSEVPNNDLEALKTQLIKEHNDKLAQWIKPELYQEACWTDISFFTKDSFGNVGIII